MHRVGLAKIPNADEIVVDEVSCASPPSCHHLNGDGGSTTESLSGRGAWRIRLGAHSVSPGVAASAVRTEAGVVASAVGEEDAAKDVHDELSPVTRP